VGLLGAGGSYVGGKAMRALGESMGMSEAGILTMEAFGELGGGMLGGAAGVKGIRMSRQATATKFYREQGYDPNDIPGHVNGIDFNRPVSVHTLKAGTTVSQHQVPGGRQGNYYAPPGTKASELGISPQGTSRTTGQVVDKTVTNYTTTRDVPVLRSTARNINDTWSVEGTSYATKGGGTQYFSADKGAFGIGP
jgi:Bacterial toxin 46